MMKLWNLFGFGVITLALATGCNKHPENLNGPEIEDDGEPLYVSMNLQLPMASPGTRSETIDPDGEGDISTGGHEDGQDFENRVQTVLLVMAGQDDTYIAHQVTGRIALDPANGQLTVTAPVKKTLLGTYYTNNRVAGETGDEMHLAKDKEKIRLYAYCNPPQDLLDQFSKVGETVSEGKKGDASWLHFTCKVGETKDPGRTDTEKEEGSTDGENQSIWARNSFLMSNTEIYPATLPVKYSEWEQYATAANPFKFGVQDNGFPLPIKVERSVARFDFKDGSPKETPANTYDVTTTGASNGKLQVQLVRMSLVNMSNAFYYLKRVTKDNKIDSEQVICGLESPYNWVVDTDWDQPHKKDNRDENYRLDVKELRKFYNFSLFGEEGTITEATRSYWNNHRIDNVLKQQKVDDYHIWRYVTENTIPNAMHQSNGVSTGIVFKGKLIAEKAGPNAANKDLLDAINGEYKINMVNGKPIGYTYQIDARDENGDLIYENDGVTVKKLTYPILYMFNDMLYVGWNHQIRPYLEDPAQNGSALVKAAQMTDENGKTVDELYQELVKIQNGEMAGEVEKALKAFQKAATQAGFTLYQASNDEADGAEKGFGPGYYFYYYYWNRHNDNGRPGTMGAMEFGVVRNNIYKLSVKSIHNLGHPRISDNDPDKPTPETPNEDAKVYLEVAVEVRPWTVRLNEIEF